MSTYYSIFSLLLKFFKYLLDLLVSIVIFLYFILILNSNLEHTDFIKYVWRIPYNLEKKNMFFFKIEVLIISTDWPFGKDLGKTFVIKS